MDVDVSTRYVLYTYQPSLPYYFEQTDIIEMTLNGKGQIDLNFAIEEACKKNYCSSDEIKIIGVFESKNELEEYLTQHDLRYLS